ncbi:hypothetical protein VPH35_120677 [Triticum aestivum]
MAAMPIFDGVDDAVEYIYNYVMDSSDEEELDTIWIRSPRPFVIELSLRTIQDTMRGDTWVNPNCFDPAVRKLTSDAIQRNAGTDFVGSTHMFDLRFHRLARVLIQTGLGQAECTNLLINNGIVWPLPKYGVLMTPSIHLLPLYLVDSSYGLLAVNIENRRTLLIDHSNESFLGSEDFHDKELKKEARIVLQEFGSVLQQGRPGLNPHLVNWPQDHTFITAPRLDSGLKVLQEMAHQDDTRGHNMSRTSDSIHLRKHLLVQMLMIKGNEAAGNIPAEIIASLRFLDE